MKIILKKKMYEESRIIKQKWLNWELFLSLVCASPPPWMKNLSRLQLQTKCQPLIHPSNLVRSSHFSRDGGLSEGHMVGAMCRSLKKCEIILIRFFSLSFLCSVEWIGRIWYFFSPKTIYRFPSRLPSQNVSTRCFHFSLINNCEKWDIKKIWRKFVRRRKERFDEK